MPSWSGLLDEVATSLAYTVDGAEFQVSTRDDYVAAFRGSGALGADEDIRRRPELVIAAQGHWHAAGHTGCVFAVYLSEQRDAHGWESYASDNGDPAALAATIDELVVPRLAAPETEVVSLLLPFINDAQALAPVLHRLDDMENWEVRELDTENDDELGALICLGIRTRVEFDHWSEVLGFGALAGQARTRLAPFTELAIRAKPPSRPRPRKKRAYMADIEVPFETKEMMDMWEQTRVQRTVRLGVDHDTRGKAKVSFVMEQSIWGETDE